MVKVITSPVKHDMEHVLGKFLDESYIRDLVCTDTDFYAPSMFGKNSEENIIFKFRKNVFSPELQRIAYENMGPAAQRTENRGLASGTKEEMEVTGSGREWVTNFQREMLKAIINGEKSTLFDEDPIDRVLAKYPTKESRLTALGEEGKNNVWVISRFRGKFNFEEWLESIRPLNPEQRARAAEEVSEMQSETSYGNPVNSGIAGFFDRYPRIPFGRATTFTRDNRAMHDRSLPYFQELGKWFEKLLPERYKYQLSCCNKLDPEFVIEGTPFTTLTINKNFRTAAHRDAGDLSKGFSNLTVVTNGKRFRGGYLVLPEYEVAVDLQPGDLLLVNNHEGIHGNTEIIPIDEGAERISFVSYFRENMLLLGSKKYEDARFNFIESRRLDSNHPGQRFRWNGISPNMWESDEWYHYLKNQEDGMEMLSKYHPEAIEKENSLEEFFA